MSINIAKINDRLGNDVFFAIFQFIETFELLKFGQVNKLFNKLIEDSRSYYELTLHKSTNLKRVLDNLPKFCNISSLVLTYEYNVRRNKAVRSLLTVINKNKLEKLDITDFGLPDTIYDINDFNITRFQNIKDLYLWHSYVSCEQLQYLQNLVKLQLELCIVDNFNNLPTSINTLYLNAVLIQESDALANILNLQQCNDLTLLEMSKPKMCFDYVRSWNIPNFNFKNVNSIQHFDFIEKLETLPLSKLQLDTDILVNINHILIPTLTHLALTLCDNTDTRFNDSFNNITKNINMLKILEIQNLTSNKEFDKNLYIIGLMDKISLNKFVLNDETSLFKCILLNKSLNTDVLRILDLESVVIDDINMLSTFASFPELEELLFACNMGNIKIISPTSLVTSTDTKLPKFLKLKKFKILYYDPDVIYPLYNRISDDIMIYCSSMMDLTDLNIDMYISRQGIDAISKMINLKRLVIGNINCYDKNDIRMSYLKPLENLSQLISFETKIMDNPSRFCFDILSKWKLTHIRLNFEYNFKNNKGLKKKTISKLITKFTDILDCYIDFDKYMISELGTSYTFTRF